MPICGFLPVLAVCCAVTFLGCNGPAETGAEGAPGQDAGVEAEPGADGGETAVAENPGPSPAGDEPAAESPGGDAIALSPENTTITYVGTKDDGKHDGGFRKLDGSLVLDGDAVQSISVVVPTESLWADNPKLEGHLKNRDFFEVEAHPELSFVAKQIEPATGGEATHTLFGELTMLGETHPIELPATVEVTSDKVNLASNFTIDRTQWGMNYGQGQVHNEVQISVKIDASR